MAEPATTSGDGVFPAVKVAGVTGAAGLLVGGVTGTLRGTPHPALWTAASGLQWALLGGTYWSIRSALLASRGTPVTSPQTKCYVSAASGALSAAVVGAVTRGRANIIPGMIAGSVFGFVGQAGYAALDRRHTETVLQGPKGVSEPLWKRAFDSKWSPIRTLSDEDYKKILEEKLLKIDVEIAVLADDIAAAKRAGAEETGSRRPDAPE